MQSLYRPEGKTVRWEASRGSVNGLQEKIEDHSAAVGVIGLGYVGLPLAVEMAKAGFHVTGIDLDRQKIDSIDAGISYLPDVPSDIVYDLVSRQQLRATQSLATVDKLDAVSVCVPTPLRKTKDPDLSYVIAAVEAIHNQLRPGQLIVLESTMFPGAMRELVLPILQRSGLKVGKDFYLAYSPDRVDPGNRSYTTKNIPKVIGGMTPRCAELGALFYRQFVDSVVPVSSPDVAEMVKLLENTFRCVNIALANEMALMCRKFDIDVWEVIEAAKTKPFGFMPFYPGPGLGGHSLPVDPYYLTWRASMDGFEPRLIDLAGQINSQMPGFTVSRIADALNEREKSLKGSKILVLGITYKRDTNDIRESAALEVVRGLQGKGALVSYSDPYVSSVMIDSVRLDSTTVAPDVVQSVDCVVVLTDHSSFDYAMVVDNSLLIVDCRNALKDFASDKIFRL